MIVLLANGFCTVNRVNLLGDDVRVAVGSARNGREAGEGSLHLVEDVRREGFVGGIVSHSLSLHIRRDTAQRWIFRWKFVWIKDERILSAENARLVMEEICRLG